MNCERLVFREHALLRMVARRFTRTEVESVLVNGRVIAEHPSAKPFPSKLLLGSLQGRPLPVFAAQDETGYCYVVTAYEPDPALWTNDFTLKNKL